jgi:hypothetical protein
MQSLAESLKLLCEKAENDKLVTRLDAKLVWVSHYCGWVLSFNTDLEK